MVDIIHLYYSKKDAIPIMRWLWAIFQRSSVHYRTLRCSFPNTRCSDSHTPLACNAFTTAYTYITHNVRVYQRT